MVKKLLVFILFSFMFTLYACYYDNEEDIYAKFNSKLNCDTIDVSYTKNLRYFFDTNCASCHDGSHPTCNLNNYNNAHSYATQPNTNLYTVVVNNDHKNRVLTGCELKQLKLWIENGAQ